MLLLATKSIKITNVSVSGESISRKSSSVFDASSRCIHWPFLLLIKDTGMKSEHLASKTFPTYSRAGNIREVLIFEGETNSRIQESREKYFLIVLLIKTENSRILQYSVNFALV